MIKFRKEREEGYFVLVKETWLVESKKQFNEVMVNLVRWGFEFTVKPSGDSTEEFLIKIDSEICNNETPESQIDILEDILRLKEKYGDLD